MTEMGQERRYLKISTKTGEGTSARKDINFGAGTVEEAQSRVGCDSKVVIPCRCATLQVLTELDTGMLSASFEWKFCFWK